MIIGTFKELEIGKVYNKDGTYLTDKNKNLHKNVSFMVLKKATHEDWIKEYNEDGGKLTSFEIAYSSMGNFYEISVD